MTPLIVFQTSSEVGGHRGTVFANAGTDVNSARIIIIDTNVVLVFICCKKRLSSNNYIGSKLQKHSYVSD